MSFQSKYLKYKSKYLELKKQVGGAISIGDAVRERDSLMTGVIVEQHSKYFPAIHLVMKGDDGKIYDRNTHHFTKLSDESDSDRAEIESKLQQKAQQSEFRNPTTLYIGDRVIEGDTSIKGVIIDFDDKKSICHAVMQGDNGKIYNHNLSHYTKIIDE